MFARNFLDGAFNVFKKHYIPTPQSLYAKHRSIVNEFIDEHVKDDELAEDIKGVYNAIERR